MTVDVVDDDNTPASDYDSADVTGYEGPGVGTPGFWKNWPEVWDGDTSNDDAFAGRDWFPEADILYPIVGEDPGLLIGDWNLNGVCDSGEECIYLTLEQAQYLIDSSNYNDGKDKRYTLARSLVAAWLNVIAGNDFVCVEDDINDGIAWLIDKKLPPVPGDNDLSLLISRPIIMLGSCGAR